MRMAVGSGSPVKHPGWVRVRDYKGDVVWRLDQGVGAGRWRVVVVVVGKVVVGVKIAVGECLC